MAFKLSNNNMSQQYLINSAIHSKECMLSDKQALVVTTGSRTGRSPKDRFFVKTSLNESSIAWGGNNQPFDESKYQKIFEKVSTHLQESQCFSGQYHVGAHKEHYQAVRVHTSLAWHQLFASYLFINPKSFNPLQKEPWTILHAPNLKLDPAVDGSNSDGIVLIHIDAKQIVIAGIHYAGEIKKAMFTVMNYLCPENDILPMHCAATEYSGNKTALFFGLSGTGKTTLSSNPNSLMIGDDEHGWSTEGIFNFEGGCYAKCINLHPEKEPVIYQAIKKDAIIENVVLDRITAKPNYADTSLTENSRAAYPLSYIEQRKKTSQGSKPSTVVFLTCDLFGVLPAVSHLSIDQAIYYFISGYTAKIGSTEVGSSGAIKPVFSPCFGAPFFPRHIQTYATLLKKRLIETKANVYLVNTGWMGGQDGKRFDINFSRAIVDTITTQDVSSCFDQTLPIMNLSFPSKLPGLTNEHLDPKNAWENQKTYYKTLSHLAEQFIDNAIKTGIKDDIILQSGPISYKAKSGEIAEHAN
jgi:phosphoenolpyruvate carboxykinase (ATP)